MIRLLSHSEIQTALDCEYRHAFAYTGHLTSGAALRSKAIAPILREGRAWGAAAAAYHANVLRVDADSLAYTALAETLDADADELRAHGLHDDDEHSEMLTRLGSMVGHYIQETEPLPIDRLEHEIVVAIPSRAGGTSNRYRLQAFFDGIHTDDHGRVWIVDFKLRRELTAYELVVLNRQFRMYAWAAREALDIDPAGFIVDERLNAAPKPPRILKSGQPSHAKDQLTTAGLYTRACADAGVDPNPETVEALHARRWQARHRVMFRPGELGETADQLVSAAKLIHQLDSGALTPIRNPSRARCGGCPYRDICADPGQPELVDMLYERRPPKRDREPEEALVAAA